MVDPACFPLLFARGQQGYHLGIRLANQEMDADIAVIDADPDLALAVYFLLFFDL